MTTTTLLAAVAERQAQREAERAEHERRTRAAAQRQAEALREHWIAELTLVDSAVLVLRLFGEEPQNLEIFEQESFPTLLGRAVTDDGTVINLCIRFNDKSYAEVLVDCVTWDWSKRYQAISVHHLYDTVMDDVEDLLRHVEAQRAFGEEPVRA